MCVQLLDWLNMSRCMLLDYAEHWHQTLKRSSRLPFFQPITFFLPLPDEYRVQYGGDVSWYTCDSPTHYLTLPIPAYWELHVPREPGSQNTHPLIRDHGKPPSLLRESSGMAKYILGVLPPKQRQTESPSPLQRVSYPDNFSGR